MGMPDWIEPMAATLTHERFAGPEWTFEHKVDGIRLLAFKRGARVELYSRNHLPQDVPAVARAVAALPCDELILDGELEWNGSAFTVFDVLWRDGADLRERPIEERRAVLDALPLASPLRRVVVVEDAAPWERAAREGWEGVIAKRRGSVYESRRSPAWLKMKIEATQELVVGGFTDPRGKRKGLGALLVGYYEGDALVFAGKVGTGLDTAELVALRARLDPLVQDACPFTRGTGLPRSARHWVRPEVVVQVAFMEWTGHDKLRHPRLVGIRSDKAARDVVREQ
ncbi:MAG: ATP-dependent DNA ligase [Deltaproteobacteria bacterium]|nr:ATP-dependent DNA ligase [Deltaproteobacteria bacterium]